MTNRTRTDALLIAGFCAFLFFYGIGQFGLIGADEPRREPGPGMFRGDDRGSESPDGPLAGS